MTPPDSESTALVAGRLAAIETKLDQILTRDNDHEIRIRRLERALYLGIGFAAAVGSAAGSFIGTLGG